MSVVAGTGSCNVPKLTGNRETVRLKFPLLIISLRLVEVSLVFPRTFTVPVEIYSRAECKEENPIFPQRKSAGMETDMEYL